MSNKKAKGYKYVAEWETPWGQKHGVYDATEACLEEFDRLKVKPLDRDWETPLSC